MKIRNGGGENTLNAEDSVASFETRAGAFLFVLARLKLDQYLVG